jgi:hypothetical protein
MPIFTKMGKNGNGVDSVAHRGFSVAEEPHGACAQPFRALVGARAQCSGLSLEFSRGDNGGKNAPNLVQERRGKRGPVVHVGTGLKASGREGLEEQMSHPNILNFGM